MIQRLFLLPGMDGTGDLFADFVRELPGSFEAGTVAYPRDVCLSRSELVSFIQSSVPAAEPFVLVAESFSSPLAIEFAAKSPPNLAGLVLCAGFASSPLRGLLRLIVPLVAPILFRVTIPEFAAKRFLVGPDASPAMAAAVRTAIASVQPKVMASRLHTVLACDARSDLGQVRVPILYIQAQHDRLVDASCFKEIRRIQATVTLAEVAGPHLLFQRQPQQTASIVAGFAQQLI
jgi:pimeloyl-ACP methyl ester carboxylesterase